MSVTIESDLKDILNKVDQKLDKLDEKIDKFGQEFNSKIDKLDQKLNSKIDRVGQNLNNKIDKLVEDVNDLKVSTVRLEEKVEGLNKRIDFQEFINRGILIGLIVTVIGGAAKLFGFVKTP